MRRKRAAPSLAEHYRRHREAMELALEMRITPAAAAKILSDRAAAAKAREAEQRLHAKITGTPPPPCHSREGGNPAPQTTPAPAANPNPEPPAQPWMFRD